MCSVRPIPSSRQKRARSTLRTSECQATSVSDPDVAACLTSQTTKSSSETRRPHKAFSDATHAFWSRLSWQFGGY